MEPLVLWKHRQWREVLGSLAGGGEYRFTVTVALSLVVIDNNTYQTKAIEEKKRLVYRKILFIEKSFFYVSTNTTCVSYIKI